MEPARSLANCPAVVGIEARKERRRLHDAVDRIATRFGERSIGPASTLEPRPRPPEDPD